MKLEPTRLRESAGREDAGLIGLEHTCRKGDIWAIREILKEKYLLCWVGRN